MKLLIDENLSYRLVQTLSGLYPGTEHVRNLGLKSVDDSIIWKFARDNDFVIVSKDADFHLKSIVLGFPPKVIGMLVGNCPTSLIEAELLLRFSEIEHFASDPQASFLPINLSPVS